MSVKVRNYARQVDSGSWEDQFGFSAAAAANLSLVSANTVGDNKGTVTVADVVYNGASAITLSDYNSLPIGSIIRDVQGSKIHLKTGATQFATLSVGA